MSGPSGAHCIVRNGQAAWFDDNDTLHTEKVDSSFKDGFYFVAYWMTINGPEIIQLIGVE